MNYNVLIASTVILLFTACQASDVSLKTTQGEADMTSCIRTIMKLDEGRWAYMGTIARLSGKFRTYETTSVHASTGVDTWSSKSFGGDVGGTEDDAEIGHVKLMGTALVPVENGELQEDAAIKYVSCTGPDAEGRYEAELEYKLPNEDGSFDVAKNISWYSAHGSYYAEDIFNASGRVVARRSGVNTPAED